jgi:hypothetical protein
MARFVSSPKVDMEHTSVPGTQHMDVEMVVT